MPSLQTKALVKRRTLPFAVRNEQRFQNRYSNTFQFRAYDRFLCGQSLHGIVRNQGVSQAYETSVSKRRSHTKRTTLHFFVGNERFPLLLGTNNALRIFMVLSETKSALVIKNFSTLLPIYSLKFRSFQYLFLRAT